MNFNIEKNIWECEYGIFTYEGTFILQNNKFTLEGFLNSLKQDNSLAGLYLWVVKNIIRKVGLYGLAKDPSFYNRIEDYVAGNNQLDKSYSNGSIGPLRKFRENMEDGQEVKVYHLSANDDVSKVKNLLKESKLEILGMPASNLVTCQIKKIENTIQNYQLINPHLWVK